MARIIEAIMELSGGTAEVGVKGGDINKITWMNGTTPIPKADIQAKANELQAEYDAQEYARNRKKAYDSVGDQLDQLMKDMRDGTTTHQESCEAVKAKYPKPE
jgi:hypothetical protein